MSHEFWAGKRVFVTGHTGFKGSWLCLWLQQLGADVTGYALKPPTDPSLFVLAGVKHGMSSIIGDIRDLNFLQESLQAAKPEIVIHMAAQAIVNYSYSHPVETFATNVMGTVHLLEAVRNTPGIKVVLNVSSDKCYENKEWIWSYRENESMGGYDPYSSSKGCSELVSFAYRNSFFNPSDYSSHGLALASARAGNVIGGGDWSADRLIPDIMRAISDKKPVKIRHPQSIRPWQYVLEPLSGYLLLAERLYKEGPRFAESWNFGPRENDAKPVQWVVECLLKLWGDGASWTWDDRQGHIENHEAAYLKLDTAKARTYLQWSPCWSLSQALEKVVKWQREYLKGVDIRELCITQILEYQDDKARTIND